MGILIFLGVWTLVSCAACGLMWLLFSLTDKEPPLTPAEQRAVDLRWLRDVRQAEVRLEAELDRRGEEIARYKRGIKALPWFLCPEILRRRLVLFDMRMKRGDVWERYDIMSSLRRSTERCFEARAH